jgi:hypothetical protein
MYRLTSAFVVRALVAGAIVGSPAAAAAQGRVDDPTSIAGVIRLLGCEARVEQLALRAVPIVAVRADQGVDRTTRVTRSGGVENRRTSGGDY